MGAGNAALALGIVAAVAVAGIVGTFLIPDPAVPVAGFALIVTLIVALVALALLLRPRRPSPTWTDVPAPH